MSDHDDSTQRRPKPVELVDLHELTAELFAVVKRAFCVRDRHQFSLLNIDSANGTMSDKREIAVFAMRKLQALRYVTTRGVRTANIVVVCLIADLNVTLTSLADFLDDIDPTAYQVLMNSRLALNKAAVVVSGLQGMDVIELY
ncbi:hypothetical protein [Actinokineospora sp.]|uniref:hypothetical protein n=1 Tax=Actinokineospora sp. TaxID=1872133 RepID=UPI004037E767